MKKLIVHVEEYPSRYYPVNAVFTLNNVRYNIVFQDEKEMRHYFSCRFYPVYDPVYRKKG